MVTPSFTLNAHKPCLSLSELTSNSACFHSSGTLSFLAHPQKLQLWPIHLLHESFHFPRRQPTLAGRLEELGPVHHFSDMLFTHLWSPGLTLVCSALCSLRLVLFDGESWSKWGRIKSLFAQCHSGTSFLVSDSLGKQFCSIAPWYLFSVGKPELCQTLRKPVMLMKVICSHPPSSVLAPTSPQLGPLHLVPSLCGFSVLPLGILASTHSN